MYTNISEDDEEVKSGFPFKKFFNIFFILSILFYLCYHFYNGNYGFKSYINKQNIINQKNIDVIKLENEISSVKNKINKLQDTNLDSDLLDEEIRKNTGYAKKNEIILYSNDVLNK